MTPAAEQAARAIAWAEYRSGGRPRRRASGEPPPLCIVLVWQPNCMRSGNSRKTHFGQGTNAANRDLAARLHSKHAGSCIAIDVDIAVLSLKETSEV